MRRYLLLSFILIVLPVFTLHAHQPRIVESESIVVIDPEISKAYYGELRGAPHIYTINAVEDFDLYVGILVPDTKETTKDFVAEIFKDGERVAVIGGSDAVWKSFFEPFGQSTYWDGGEYKTRTEAGSYIIKVSNPTNEGKYSLAIGEIEAFDGREGVNALNLIPDLKRNFFGESPISFILSPFGWGYILIMYLLAFIFGFLYRAILKKFARGEVRRVHKNINIYDRGLRLVIWLGLLFWAITTSWSPWILFFSGFALFEATFSWCGFYAAIGKNTCPINQ